MKTFFVTFLCLAMVAAHAQYDPNYKKSSSNTLEDEEPSKVNLGFGSGIDYGGVIGVRLSAFPVKYVGLFGAAGFNLHKIGYNLGGAFRLLPDKKVCPVLMAMYGYNAVIVISGTDEYNKTYYGPSFGPGMEIRFKNNQNFLNLELLIPVRDPQFHDDIDALKNNPAITSVSDPFPVLFSIGYHIKF